MCLWSLIYVGRNNLLRPPCSTSLKLYLIIRSDNETLWQSIYPEGVAHSCSVKKVSQSFPNFLQSFPNFAGNHLCRSFFFNKVAALRPPVFNLIKKETPALVFYSELCKIFWEHLLSGAPADDCSCIFSKIFMTANFSFCNYDITNCFIISFLSE